MRALTDTPALADASLRRRYQTALVAVRHDHYDGDLYLSFVVWPDDMPSLEAIEQSVRLARRKLREQEREHESNGGSTYGKLPRKSSRARARQPGT